MANFAGLTFAAVPVVTGAGALNTSALPAGTVIAGILDPTSTQRIFNPQAEGNPVVTGDAYTKWLPTLTTLTAASVNDQFWAPVFTGSSASENATNTRVGQVKLQLAPAAANTVEAPSVMAFWLSPQAFVITATAGSF